jgi:hypothetical protein
MLTAEMLGERLTQAGAAHGVYETNELGGVYDVQWARWYAEYLIAHGVGEFFAAPPDADALAAVLTRCDEDYRRERPTQPWPTYYAPRLIATFGAA